MTPTHSLTLSGAVFATLLALFPVVGLAAGEPIDMSVVQLVPHEQNGITYLTGGIGEDESRAIQQTKGYNLHMTFSKGADNKYIADADVVIQTAQGQSVLSLSQVGPMVYVKLPADKYVIVGSRGGQEKRQTVAIDGASASSVIFHWNEGQP